MIPILIAIAVGFRLMKNSYGLLLVVALLFYFLAYDKSSVFFSRGEQVLGLIGEYIIGRSVMLIGLMILSRIDGLILLDLYTAQFFVMFIWFVFFSQKLELGTEEIKVSERKIWEYQKSDIVGAIVNYLPTILQFVFGGAFLAGLAGIISLIKRFINFISGPMAKVFLPEFSRLYIVKDINKLQKTYVMIIRIQMMFIGIIGTALVGFPHLILRLFNEELQPYAGIFTFASLCFLFIASIGPTVGFLQMTENEKICNMNRWISIVAMFAVWVVFRKSPMFIIYGLCAQVVVEGILQYNTICKWFHASIVSVENYMCMWLPILLGRLCVEIFELQYSFLALLVFVIVIGLWNFVCALHDPLVKEAVREGLKKLKR